MLVLSHFKDGTIIPDGCPDGRSWCLQAHWSGRTERCLLYGGRESSCTICERDQVVDEEET